MKPLHISVVDKIATYQKRDGDIVCGNSDYQIQFAFDSEWDTAAEKTARFIYNDQYVDIVFQGDTCDVPVIRNAELLAVGVFSGNLKTSTPAFISCVKSILCQHGTPSEPTPDVYSQIIDLLNKSSNIGLEQRVAALEQMMVDIENALKEI